MLEDIHLLFFYGRMFFPQILIKGVRSDKCRLGRIAVALFQETSKKVSLQARILSLKLCLVRSLFLLLYSLKKILPEICKKNRKLKVIDVSFKSSIIA